MFCVVSFAVIASPVLLLLSPSVPAAGPVAGVVLLRGVEMVSEMAIE